MTVTTDTEAWRDVDELKACVWSWAERIHVKPRRVQVQQMTRKWASCSPSGTITLSTELLARNRAFGEAVVVHELLHLSVPNHSKLFWSLLRAYLPGAEDVLNGEARCGVPGLGRRRRMGAARQASEAS